MLMVGLKYKPFKTDTKENGPSKLKHFYEKTSTCMEREGRYIETNKYGPLT